MKLLVALAVGLSALALAVSVWTANELKTIKPVYAPSTSSTWTPADEAAVAILTNKTPQQLGGYIVSLRRGTQRHKFTESQLQEALRRLEVDREQRVVNQSR